MVIHDPHMQPPGGPQGGDPGGKPKASNQGKGCRGKNDKTSDRGKGKGNWGGKAHRVNPPSTS
eukprot:966375-Karenia_brevis.AAC.1